MAWKNIPGRPGWLFKDDAVVPSFTYLGAGTSVANAAKTTAGVRTEGGVQTYIQTRKTTDAETVNRGEIDATSTLASVGVSGPQPASFFSDLPAVGGGGVQPFGGQAFTYALTSETDPTSANWTAKQPAGYTYYPGEGIGADAPITDMNSMFLGKSTFNEDISSWDVSSVTNMSSMFNNTNAFNQDISSWDVSSVTNMSAMFQNNSGFNNGGVALNWGTKTASVRFMSAMFNNADAFNQDISSWNVSTVTTMSGMFSNTNAFNNGGVALGGTFASTMTSVANMSNMFFDTNAFNQDISSWNVSSVTNMTQMFNNNSGFNQDISSWNVSSVSFMNSMFFNADAFNQDLSGWNVNNVTNASGFSSLADQKGTLAANWQEAEHPSNVGLGNFYNT